MELERNPENYVCNDDQQEGEKKKKIQSADKNLGPIGKESDSLQV